MGPLAARPLSPPVAPEAVPASGAAYRHPRRPLCAPPRRTGRGRGNRGGRSGSSRPGGEWRSGGKQRPWLVLAPATGPGRGGAGPSRAKQGRSFSAAEEETLPRLRQLWGTAGGLSAPWARGQSCRLSPVRRCRDNVPSALRNDHMGFTTPLSFPICAGVQKLDNCVELQPVPEEKKQSSD